jgi:lipooligosaccharide transport system permease protein
MAAPPLRLLEHNLRTFQHVWRWSAAGAATPFFFLGAIGLGLGSLVSHRSPGLGGGSYLVFLAPGLLVANAMQIGAVDGAWPAMARARWNRVYHAVLASPLRLEDLLAGEAIWVGLRLLFFGSAFFVAMLVFGAVGSAWSVLAVPVSVLTGLAFYMPVMAVTGVIARESIYSIVFRLGVTPLFVLGGAFFPVDHPPGGLSFAPWAGPLFRVIEWVVQLTPVFHGIGLARDLNSGRLELADLFDLLIVMAFIVAGFLAAQVTFRRQLLP